VGEEFNSRLTRSSLRLTTLSSPAAERGVFENRMFFYFVILRNEGSILEFAGYKIDASLRSAWQEIFALFPTKPKRGASSAAQTG
jgi:hypothetical protein